MKTLLTSLLFLTGTACFADVAVYSGSQVSKVSAGAGVRTTASGIFQVIDLASQQVVTIALGREGSHRSYAVAPTAQVVRAEISARAGRGGSSTVLAQAGTQTDATSGVTTVAAYNAAGVNLPVVIKGTAATSLPRNLQGTGSVVTTPSTSGDAIPASQTSVKTVLNLQVILSRQANDAAETLDQAVARVTASLASRGFVDANAPVAP